MRKNWKDPRADVQKDLGWTAGSILEKLRDLNVKNRSWLEILLNYHGPRVDSEKTQGLFSKSAWLKRYTRI